MSISMTRRCGTCRENPFRPSAYPAIVDDLIRYVRSALGRIRKCVVVDLDQHPVGRDRGGGRH